MTSEIPTGFHPPKAPRPLRSGWAQYEISHPAKDTIAFGIYQGIESESSLNGGAKQQESNRSPSSEGWRVPGKGETGEWPGRGGNVLFLSLSSLELF